jgi:hypothetical protein
MTVRPRSRKTRNSDRQLPGPVEKITGNQTSRPRRDEADHLSNDDAHNS